MSAVEEEQLDPRIQIELEKLNTATDDINKLEAKLEEANNVFRTTLTESTARLNFLAKKLGSCIEKARPYYEAQELARSSQLDCQRAAVQYQRANALHQAAKETIALAEERFVNSPNGLWQFDSAWQEMLNHATIKVMEAEAQKAASEREHMRRAAAFTQTEQRVQRLHRGLKSAINKSLVYFNEKSNVQSQLETQKERVQQLQRAVTASKTSYAQSLRSLEQISEEIHEQRRCQLPREPGVGAELTPPEPSDNQTESESAKVHTALEEMTAQEEKYWESLREKLEKIQVESANHNTTPMVDEDPGSNGLEVRERSVTGSSCLSNSEGEGGLDMERVISGESSNGSESDEALSPLETKEIHLSFEGPGNDATLGGKPQDDSSNMEEQLDDIPTEPCAARKSPDGGNLMVIREDTCEDAVDGNQTPSDRTPTPGSQVTRTPTPVSQVTRTPTPGSQVTNNTWEDSGCENYKENGNEIPCSLNSVSIPNSPCSETLEKHELIEGHIEDLDDKDIDISVVDDESIDNVVVSMSQPPAMCQPSKALSRIPEESHE